jgi:dTDP-glucose 4,6-dehydratase
MATGTEPAMSLSTAACEPPARVLVTGGCGFIGSALVRHLIGARRAHVLNIDKLTYAADPASVADVAGDAGYAFAEVDICDAAMLQQELLRFSPDAVVHLAAETHVDRSLDDPEAFIGTNVIGTFNVLEAARQHWRGLDHAGKTRFRLLHVSTDEVYGSLPANGDERFHERSRYAPNSPYAASKAAADHLARAWARSYGLPVIVSNCSNNYGPFQFPDKLIPRMIIAALEGRRLPVYGTGDNRRDWLHVEDHVRALDLILARGMPGKTYLIGGGAERRNIDLVRTLCATVDELAPDSAYRPHEGLIAFVADRPGHDLRYAVDDSRLRRELGWEPQETLDTGLRRTVAWYLENRAWCERLRTRYDGRRLGLGSARQSETARPGS